ncbi:MAG: VIT domain-containing protein [Thermoanaerobaculaceae bacterium]
MNTPTPRDVERMLQSMADQEPPEGLLERLEATVPEEIPTPVVLPFEPRVQKWNRSRLLTAALGLAATLAIGAGLAGLLGQLGPSARSVVTTADLPTPTPVPPVATPVTLPTPPLLPSGLPKPAVIRRQATPQVSGQAAPSQGVEWPTPAAEPSAPIVLGDASGQSDEPVRVKAGETTRLDVVMRRAAVAEEITVTGSYETISSASQASTTIEKSLVASLPRGKHLYSRAREAEATPSPEGLPGDVLFGFAGGPDQLLVIEGSEGYLEDTETLRVGDNLSGGRAALEALTRNGEAAGEMPLKHTTVKADIAGFMARTEVTQEYVNTFTEPIEAVYVFPLGAMAAVNDFVMEVGERRIVGVVRPREEAERIYRQARERGQTASLLTQERPNVFTQNVANIAPGGTVTITITTFETLPHDRGTFEYVFPMVVGPRYIPGAQASATPAVVGGGGWSAPTTVVPDADRITPPVLEPGQRSGHDVDLEVRLDAGLPIAEVRSVVHPVTVTEDGPSRRTITLASGAAIPNRDFVLRWKVAGDKLQTGVLTYRNGGEGYLALLVQPPLDPEDALVAPREITFVLDVSGSMSGVPIETSKNLVRRVLDKLRPADAFNIFVFAGSNGQLWDEPRGSSPENVAEAKRYLSNLYGAGGTEMLAGLRRAITGAHDPARLQMYVFCTDGFVGDEERILAFVQQERGEARFFAFGIGSSVNRHLIDGIGRLGGGASMVVLPRELGAAERVADRFFSMIDAPVLVDAAIDWNGLPVADAYPSRLGDLFTGGAFNVVARYTRKAAGTAYLTGRLGTRTVRFPIEVKLPRQATDHPELAPVWARQRIADLSVQMLTADAARAAELKKTITELAIEYRLASPFTSFVAVDESEVHGDGKPKRVNQKVPMPQDVRHEGVFGPRK